MRVPLQTKNTMLLIDHANWTPTVAVAEQQTKPLIRVSPDLEEVAPVPEFSAHRIEA